MLKQHGFAIAGIITCLFLNLSLILIFDLEKEDFYSQILNA